MQLHKLALLVFAATALFVLAAAYKREDEIPGSYLVTLRADQEPSVIAQELGFEQFREIGPEGTRIFLFTHKDKSRNSVRSHVDALSGHPAVHFVEPDHFLDLKFKQVFNDPELPNYWHLKASTGNMDINVHPVWARGNHGEGVIVGIVDSGIFTTGSDLSANVDSTVSVWLEDNSANWQPSTPAAGDFDHGTFVGSTVAGMANNSFCGVGVAYGATIGAMKYGSSSLASTVIASIGFQNNKIWIKNYSLGFTGCQATRQCQLDAISQTVTDALEGSVTTGRDGKGMLHVWAASNEGDQGGDTNMSGFTASRCDLTVAATGPDGVMASYSNFGAGVHVCAPGGAGSPNDLKGSSLLSSGSAGCTEGSGTSFAAPVVSGIIALMLNANANLGWRDVKEILLKTARKNAPGDADWFTNGAGYNINHKYGFGYVDADAAVRMASTWTNVGAETKASATSSAAVNLVAGQTITTPITINENIYVEHVQLTLTITGGNASTINIVLTSPAGTSSTLIQGTTNFVSTTFDNWKMLTVRNWGESSKGTWNLAIFNQDASQAASLDTYTLEVYGRQSSSTSSDASRLLPSFF